MSVYECYIYIYIYIYTCIYIYIYIYIVASSRRVWGVSGGAGRSD